MNPSTAQARVVVDEWVRSGVTDAVACPGSRNAPFLLALHAADAAGLLRLHVRVDERSAGFLAVGLAARSGRPVPVVVTSGSAVANLHPAVLEASYGGVAVLVVSADRPLELVGTGANQTVDQIGLFGTAVRAVVVLPLAEDRPGAARTWRAAVARALDRATGSTGSDPGPVQIDVPLREPLVPDPDDRADHPEHPDRPDHPGPGDHHVPGAGRLLPLEAGGRPGGAPWTRRPGRRAPGVGAPLVLDPALPTLVVAGHGASAPHGLPPGVPVIAEPTSGLWGAALRAGPRLLAAVLAADAAPADARPTDARPADARPARAGAHLLPAQVVVLGRPTLHRAVSRLLAHPDVVVHAAPALAPDGTSRPGWTDVAGVVASVGDLPGPGDWVPDPAWAGPGPGTWSAAWAAADAAVADAVAAAHDDDPRATGPAVAAAVAAALPPGALLVAGSSNPVRDLALAAAPRGDVRVLGARGVSGIDGAVSFATGAALAHDGPAWALLGDLTFLHDAGGLLVPPSEPRPDLTIVVADDDGGSIFAGLEPGAPALAGAFERVFAVPHGTDLAALCAAHHVPHERPADPAALRAALAARPGAGVRVVEVTVDRTDRRALGERLAALAGRVLAATCSGAPADDP